MPIPSTTPGVPSDPALSILRSNSKLNISEAAMSPVRRGVTSPECEPQAHVTSTPAWLRISHDPAGRVLNITFNLQFP